MIQGYELTKKFCKFYLDSTTDRQHLIEKILSKNISRHIGQIERRIDKIEALKDAFSENTGSHC